MTHSYLYNRGSQVKIHRMKVLISILFFLHTTLNLAAEAIIIKSAETGAFSWFQQSKQLTIYNFNSKEHCLQIIDKPSTSLKESLILFRCLAGVNGGFFQDDAEKSPLGLLIQDGVVISNPHNQGFWATGILYDTGNGIRLERKHRLSTKLQAMQQAIQSGPFLVENGRIVKGLNNNKTDRRTFIATDNKGNWCIGISTRLSLQELAEWLADSPKELGFRIDCALNLDGGTSSGFYESESGLYEQPLKNVRNFLGIKKRENRLQPSHSASGRDVAPSLITDTSEPNESNKANSLTSAAFN